MTDNVTQLRPVDDLDKADDLLDAELNTDTVLAEGEEPKYHPLLMIWREVLKPATAEADAKPSPQWCNKMVQSYTGIGFDDMYTFRDTYFGKIQEMVAILDEVIASDKECLTYTSAEEDRAENRALYLRVITEWQCQVLRWELRWDCRMQYAEVELAAISEVHKIFFDQTGIANFLDNIGFPMEEGDRDNLAAALNAVREEEK